MDCSTSGSSVLCCLPEFVPSHVYWVGNVIQPSHPLPPPSFFCFQSFPESFPVNQLFIAGGQSIRASASGLPMNIQSWFPLGLTGLISLLSKGLSSIFSRTPIWKHQFFGAQLSLWSNSCIHTWLLGKTIILTIWTFVVKVMFLLFNTLSRFVLVKVHQKKTRWLFPITQKSAEELDGYFV